MRNIKGKGGEELMRIIKIMGLSALLLWLTACSDQGVTNPPVQSDELEINGSFPGVALTQRYAGTIVDAPGGTYFQCGSGEVYAATEGDALYGGCQIWNEEGEPYAIEIEGAHDLVLPDGLAEVAITNPVGGVRYRLLTTGPWISVTSDVTVMCSVVRIGGDGSAQTSTSVKIEIHSGFNEN